MSGLQLLMIKCVELDTFGDCFLGKYIVGAEITLLNRNNIILFGLINVVNLIMLLTLSKLLNLSNLINLMNLMNLVINQLLNSR